MLPQITVGNATIAGCTLKFPIIGYIYSPFEEIPNYAAPTRYVFLPVLVLTGLWMWKGYVLGKLISKRSQGRSAW